MAVVVVDKTCPLPIRTLRRALFSLDDRCVLIGAQVSLLPICRCVARPRPLPPNCTGAAALAVAAAAAPRTQLRLLYGRPFGIVARHCPPRDQLTWPVTAGRCTRSSCWRRQRPYVSDEDTDGGREPQRKKSYLLVSLRYDRKWSWSYRLIERRPN